MLLLLCCVDLAADRRSQRAERFSVSRASVSATRSSKKDLNQRLRKSRLFQSRAHLPQNQPEITIISPPDHHTRALRVCEYVYIMLVAYPNTDERRRRRRRAPSKSALYSRTLHSEQRQSNPLATTQKHTHLFDGLDNRYMQAHYFCMIIPHTVWLHVARRALCNVLNNVDTILLSAQRYVLCYLCDVCTSVPVFCCQRTL